MADTIYTFLFKPDWMHLTNQISSIDRFDASWSSIEKREGQTLKQLKSIATVRSVGASTRIEGSKMTDDEVALLIQDLSIAKLEERDQQEVAGYFQTLELISESYQNIEINESNLKALHKSLMVRSDKDAWHRGNYKQHSNVVEAQNPDGSKYVIFQTTDPGFATEEAMHNLVKWYHSDRKTHSLIKAALFIYDFLSIHPFQDGNGRLSRLLGTSLLLKNGYSWIQYVSFEHEIENRKSEYYRVLMQCQRERPGEDVYPWVIFFLDCLQNIQEQLMAKLEVQTKASKMSKREKMIYTFIENHPASRSGEIAEKLDIPLPTVKRMLAEMIKNKYLETAGAGVATNYSVITSETVQRDLTIRLTRTQNTWHLNLMNPATSLEIKKIILTPLFQWQHPDEWVQKLAQNALTLEISYATATGNHLGKLYSVFSFNTPYHYQPVFALPSPITVPNSLWEEPLYKKDYPLQVTIKATGQGENFDFDVLIIYDKL